jgi:site-specific DNA-methyltransferase (adenine-specific)
MILHCDCLTEMQGMDAESFDSIITDPPYGLKFMGAAWDHGVPGEPFWSEALRVAKPGSYLLAFGGTRTWHRLACAIEDAGWEIRDTLCWLYGSGFPKGKRCLKPAWEPIIMARKAGPGDLQIEACRLEYLSDNDMASATPQGRCTTKASGAIGATPDAGRGIERIESPRNPLTGRWPANVILDEQAAEMLDSGVGETSSTLRINDSEDRREHREQYRLGPGVIGSIRTFGDSGGPSRFFYCAKASRSEREAGCEHLTTKTGAEAVGRKQGSAGTKSPRAGAGRSAESVHNYHPTVKPLALMRWLCRLVTQPRGLILDPFAGSGTTGCAAAMDGFRFVGCEKEAEYSRIAEARITCSSKQPSLHLEA